jgi:hypothetical protein
MGAAGLRQDGTRVISPPDGRCDCWDKLTPCELPRDVEVSEAIRDTAVGKVDKKALRKSERAESPG